MGTAIAETKPSSQTDPWQALRHVVSEFEDEFPKSQDLKGDIANFIDDLRRHIDELSFEGKQSLSNICFRLVQQILKGSDVDLRNKLESLADILANYSPVDQDFESRASYKIKIH